MSSSSVLLAAIQQSFRVEQFGGGKVVAVSHRGVSVHCSSNMRYLLYVRFYSKVFVFSKHHSGRISQTSNLVHALA